MTMRRHNGRTDRLLALISLPAMMSVLAANGKPPGREAPVLGTAALERYVDAFNANDPERIETHIPNADAKFFLKANVPLFACPDRMLEEIYYFRWWTFRKHIKETPDGFVIIEFLPKVS